MSITFNNINSVENAACNLIKFGIMNCSCSSGLGLSGDFSVPLSEVEAGSLSRNSTQVSGSEALAT